jgi:hypothetical protein
MVVDFGWPGAFSLLVVFSLVVALTWKIVLGISVAPALRPVVALEVIWEGCHHRDRSSSHLPDWMILVETVSEVILKVVMTASEMMVVAVGNFSARLFPCSRGLWCNVWAVVWYQEVHPWVSSPLTSSDL